jgi:hypothetical protein
MEFLENSPIGENEALCYTSTRVIPITDDNVGYAFDEEAKLWLDSSGNLRLTITWNESDILEYIANRVQSGSIRQRNENSTNWTLFLSGNNCVPYAVEIFGPFMSNVYKLEKWKRIINAANKKV